MTPTVWDNIEPFNQGGAAVEKFRKWGVIDRSGEMLVEPELDWGRVFSGGLISVDKTVLDGDGELLEFFRRWKTIEILNNDDDVYIAVEDQEGRWGLIDTQCKTVIEPMWDAAPSRFIGEVSVVRKDGNDGLVGKLGNVVVEPEWDRILSDWWYHDLLPAERNGKWGFLNRSGKLVMPCQWDEVGLIELQRFAKVRRGSFWGVVDNQGRVVIEPELDSVSSDCQGFVKVQKGNFWGLVDDQGIVVVEPNKWKSVVPLAPSFGGESYPKEPESNFYEVRSDRTIGIINGRGDTVIQPASRWLNIQFANIIEEQDRIWQVYSCTPKQSEPWVGEFYDYLNALVIRFSPNEIRAPSNQEHYIVIDQTGKQIWQSRPYSPLIFIIATAALIVMTVFVLLWLIAYRRSGA